MSPRRKRNRRGVVRRVLNENEIVEESSGESSTKTKSSRSRPASPQRKRNRRGVVRRVLNENEIVEESSGESSTKTKSSRSRPASPQRKRNRRGVVRQVGRAWRREREMSRGAD